GRPQPGRGGGGPPVPGGAPGMGPGQQPGAVETNALSVQAVVHVLRRDVLPPVPGMRGNAQSTKIGHKWSAAKHWTQLFNDNQTLISRDLGTPQGGRLPSAESRYET